MFIHKIEQLIQKVIKFQHCVLVLVSILPCPKSDDLSKEAFREANNRLKVLSQQYKSHVSFLDNSKKIVFDRNIDLELFENDESHMNCDGAREYANSIKQHLKFLSNKYFKK